MRKGERSCACLSVFFGLQNPFVCAIMYREYRKKDKTLATKTLRKDFTQGNISRQLLLFALPFMASNAMQVLYSAIDMVIVGKFVGTFGLSAVSQSSLIVNFATMVCLGFSNAGQF